MSPSSGMGRRSGARTPRGSREALGDLIRVSRQVGADPDLVQGGGGNTSVKTRDGRTIVVKASGTLLGEMDEERGWAALDLERLGRVLSDRRLEALRPARREKEVLRLLGDTVLEPRGARPSVESSLHALLGRVVIHTHPVGLNAFLCSRRSRRLWPELLGRRSRQAVYVPYVDPGFVLARRVEKEVARHRRAHGAPPSVVLLENHGLFVAAEEAGEALELSREVCERGRRFIGGSRVNPLAAWPPRELEPGELPGAAPVRQALLRGGAPPAVLERDASPLAGAVLRRPDLLRAALRGAFTPDGIVYCRTSPLLLPPAPVLGEGWLEAAARRVAAYLKKRRLDPRVLLVPGAGIFYAAPDLAQLGIVREVYRSTLAVLVHSRKAGGPRFLDRRQAGFIEGWEVEAFRARLLQGSARPLRGRVAALLGARDGEAVRLVQALVSRGATVVPIGRPGELRPLLRRLGGALGSCRHLFRSPGLGEGATLQAAESQLGGVDLVLDLRREARAVVPLDEERLLRALMRAHPRES